MSEPGVRRRRPSETRRLTDRVECAIGAGVGTGTGDPQPGAGAVCDVAVDEKVEKVPRVGPPLEVQVLHEERYHVARRRRPRVSPPDISSDDVAPLTGPFARAGPRRRARTAGRAGATSARARGAAARAIGSSTASRRGSGRRPTERTAPGRGPRASSVLLKGRVRQIRTAGRSCSRTLPASVTSISGVRCRVPPDRRRCPRAPGPSAAVTSSPDVAPRSPCIARGSRSRRPGRRAC